MTKIYNIVLTHLNLTAVMEVALKCLLMSRWAADFQAKEVNLLSYAGEFTFYKFISWGLVYKKATIKVG